MELLRIANYKELQEWEKCVTLLIDEMHLKEDLVYDKGTGAMVGFTSFVKINDHLLKVCYYINDYNFVYKLIPVGLHSLKNLWIITVINLQLWLTLWWFSW